MIRINGQIYYALALLDKQIIKKKKGLRIRDYKGRLLNGKNEKSFRPN